MLLWAADEPDTGSRSGESSTTKLKALLCHSSQGETTMGRRPSSARRATRLRNASATGLAAERRGTRLRAARPSNDSLPSSEAGCDGSANVPGMDQPIAVVTGGTGALARPSFPSRAPQLQGGDHVHRAEEATALEDKLDLDEDQLLLRRVDTTDPEAVNVFMKDTVEAFGGINVLCSLVGGWAGGRDVAETDNVRFDRMIDLNLRSTFYTLRAAVPHMRDADWGRIIAVGSKAARRPGGSGRLQHGQSRR